MVKIKFEITLAKFAIFVVRLISPFAAYDLCHKKAEDLEGIDEQYV